MNSSAISSTLSTPTLGVVQVKEEVPTDENVGSDDKIDNLQKVIDLVAIGALGGNATTDNCAKQYDGNENNRENDSIDEQMEDPVMGSFLMDNSVIEDFSVMEKHDNESDIVDVVLEEPVTEKHDNESNIVDVVMEEPVTEEDRDNEDNIEEESSWNINDEFHPVIETRAEFLRLLQGSVSLHHQLYVIYYNEERLPFLLEESETATRVLLALLNNYRVELMDKIANVVQLDTAGNVDEQYVYGDYNCLVMDELLLQHLWHRVSQEDFWQLIFPCMCDIAFFSNVPQTVREQKTLFASTRLDVLKNQYWEMPQNSDVDAYPEDKIASIMDGGDGNDEDEQQQTASAEINDRVYRAMQLEFFTILRGFLRVIWNFLLNVDDGTPVHLSIRNELIVNAYTFASFHGCILLSAPLSIFASLATMNAANFTQIEKLHDCLSRKHCGRIFETTIAYTLFAAIHYTMVSRGFRPTHIWPLRVYDNEERDKSKCPWFLLNHIALGLYHFQRGVIYNGLIADICTSCGTANRVRATNNTDTYDSVYFGRVVNICRVTDLQREYEFYLGEPSLWDEFPTDGRCLYELARYLNLCVENADAHDITRIYSKHLLKIHCRATELLQSGACSDCYNNRGIVEDSDEENASHLFRLRINRERQRGRNNAVSDVEEPVSSNQSSFCSYHDIANNIFLPTCDKFNLLHEDLINILSIFSHRSPHHDEFLQYQIHGVSAFPVRSLCVHKHLRALNILFMRQTARLVT